MSAQRLTVVSVELCSVPKYRVYRSLPLAEAEYFLLTVRYLTRKLTKGVCVLNKFVLITGRF